MRIFLCGGGDGTQTTNAYKKLNEIFENNTIQEKNPKLPEWRFGIDNDKLVELVLEGKKTATTSLDITNISKPGERSILTFENEKKACIIETKKVIITKFKNITSEMAFLEGEDNRTLEYYKRAHTDYFKTINPMFNDETEVAFEIFEVIEDLRKTRLALAERIVNNNELKENIVTNTKKLLNLK